MWNQLIQLSFQSKVGLQAQIREIDAARIDPGIATLAAVYAEVATAA